MFIKKRKNSSSIAKERLKRVLIHDRTGTPPSSQIIGMMKRDVMKVISNYVEIDEQHSEVDITNVRRNDRTFASRLTVSIPIKGVKNMGRSSY